MKKVTQSPTYTPGDWGNLPDSAYMLTTERRMYRVAYVNHASPSITQKYSVQVKTVDGQPVMLFDLIRKIGKRGERVNCAGYDGFDSLPAALEGMARHFVARFEARKVAA